MMIYTTLMHFYVLNKYTDMIVVFSCIYCAKIVHSKERFPAGSAQHFAHVQLTVSVINISGLAAISVHFFLYIELLKVK